jgi:hypothetical protein
MLRYCVLDDAASMSTGSTASETGWLVVLRKPHLETKYDLEVCSLTRGTRDGSLLRAVNRQSTRFC